MTRLSLDPLATDTLQTIALAIEDAPAAYRQRLCSSNEGERLGAVDALAGWIGAYLSRPNVRHDGQLALPIETQQR